MQSPSAGRRGSSVRRTGLHLTDDGTWARPGHNEHVDGQSTTGAWRWRRREEAWLAAAGRALPRAAGTALRRAADAMWRPSGPADQRPDLTGRAIAADIALAAVATAAGLILAGYAARSLAPPGGHQLLNHWGWWQLALLATAARMIPLAGRRLFPLAALWLSLGACALISVPGANVINFIALVPAGYSAVAHSRYRGAAMVTGAAALFVLAFPGDNRFAWPPNQGQPDNYRLLLAFLVLIPALIVGNVSYQWRRRLLSLNAEHEAATRRALELERARLASELHDVVTHNVSVMIVQAGAARQVLADAPDDARAALLSVEASGRAAMAELRYLLGLLSPADDAAADGTGGSGDHADRPELRPQPGLGQLRTLVDRVSAAGLEVDLHVDDLPADLSPGVDLAAFRVVQEALTNVIKHAGRPPTSVRVACRDGDVVVEVADAGTFAPAAAPVPGAGRGLAGLRERAELYGGELEAGPRPGGGWQVRARIPAGLLPAAAAGK
jgi:signal transduction histidine kinase